MACRPTWPASKKNIVTIMNFNTFQVKYIYSKHLQLQKMRMLAFHLKFLPVALAVLAY